MLLLEVDINGTSDDFGNRHARCLGPLVQSPFLFRLKEDVHSYFHGTYVYTTWCMPSINSCHTPVNAQSDRLRDTQCSISPPGAGPGVLNNQNSRFPFKKAPHRIWTQIPDRPQFVGTIVPLQCGAGDRRDRVGGGAHFPFTNTLRTRSKTNPWLSRQWV